MGVYKMLVLNCQKMLEINCHFLLESTCRLHKKSYLWNGYIDMLKVYPLAQPKIYVRLF